MEVVTGLVLVVPTDVLLTEVVPIDVVATFELVPPFEFVAVEANAVDPVTVVVPWVVPVIIEVVALVVPVDAVVMLAVPTDVVVAFDEVVTKFEVVAVVPTLEVPTIPVVPMFAVVDAP